MKDKMSLKELLVKGAIVGAGTIIGVIASLFVKEEDEVETGVPDIIEAEFTESMESEEVTEVSEG